MSSGARTLLGGSLKVLQDLSSGSNIPALEPLVNAAVRIYTAAEGARNNKRRANEMAEDVGTSVKQILQVYPKEANSVAGCTPDLYDDGVRKFQRTLEDAAALLEKIGGRRWMSRVFNHQPDAQELVDSRARINDARLELLVTMNMAKDRTRQREHRYPTFQQADLDVEQVWNSANPSYTRAIARLVPRGKMVVVRQYQNKLSFFEDIEHLIPLRHPNLPFVGASALTAPTPFILMEPASHTPARDFIRGFFEQSQTVLQRKAIQIITGVLEGMTHLRENKVAVSHLKKHVSSIQYDGYKVILNVDLPMRKPRTEPRPILCSSPIFPRAEITIENMMAMMNDPFNSIFASAEILEFAEEILDIHEEENHVLKGIFLFPSDLCPGHVATTTDVPSALRSIWHYCMGCESEARLHDLRGITEQLYGDQALDLAQALVATGNFPYSDFDIGEIEGKVELGDVVCPTKSGGLVVLGSILTELREKGVIDISLFVSTEVDEDFSPLREGPWEESIPRGSGVFSEMVGDYVRYECPGHGWSGVEIGRTTTISLHDPALPEIRRGLQQYFHRRLPSLLEEYSWDPEQCTGGVVLVTSIKSRRTTELTHNHDTNSVEYSHHCLHCRIWGANTEPSDLDAIRNGGIYFHALPDTIGAIESNRRDAIERNQWGIWTTILKSEGGEEVLRLEPFQKFTYTHNPQSGFEGVFVQLPLD